MPDLILSSILGKMGKFPCRQCAAQRAVPQKGEKGRTQQLSTMSSLTGWEVQANITHPPVFAFFADVTLSFVWL